MASTVESFIAYLRYNYSSYGQVSIDFFQEPNSADLRIRIIKHYQKNKNPFFIYVPYYELLNVDAMDHSIRLLKLIETQSSLDGCIEQMKRVFKK